LVLTGAGRELEQHLPYAPVIEALRGLLHRRDWPARFAHLKMSLPSIWLEETSRLLPELSGSTGAAQSISRPAEESRLWEGLFQFLSGLAGREPVILFLDDLQWADASTLALLGYMVRQSAAAPLTYLATAQPPALRSPLAGLLSTLIHENRLARLPLNRLSPQDVETIARSLSSESSNLLVDWLQRSSEGNPYVLTGWCGKRCPGGSCSRMDSSAWGAGPPWCPKPSTAWIQSRLARLPEPARQLLDVAVAAGASSSFHPGRPGRRPFLTRMPWMP
jgi:predicted ATPase